MQIKHYREGNYSTKCSCQKRDIISNQHSEFLTQTNKQTNKDEQSRPKVKKKNEIVKKRKKINRDQNFNQDLKQKNNIEKSLKEKNTNQKKINRIDKLLED